MINNSDICFQMPNQSSIPYYRYSCDFRNTVKSNLLYVMRVSHCSSFFCLEWDRLLFISLLLPTLPNVHWPALFGGLDGGSSGGDGMVAVLDGAGWLGAATDHFIKMTDHGMVGVVVASTVVVKMLALVFLF